MRKLFNIKCLPLLLCLMLYSIANYAQPYAWAIAMEGPASGGAQTHDVAVDDSGNVFVTGYFQDTVDFDPGPSVANLVSLDGYMYIAKYDAAGNYLWAKSIGSKDAQVAVAKMGIDKNGNIYFVGRIQSYPATPVDFDPGPGVADVDSYSPSTFIAKYDNDGNYQWAKSIAENAYSRGDAIAVDDAGALYITGWFQSFDPSFDTDFDPGPGVRNLNSGSFQFAAFFVKYDTHGNYVWGNCANHGVQAGGPPTYLPWLDHTGFSEGTGIALDGRGHVYAIGNLEYMGDFAPGPDTAFIGLNSDSGSHRSAYIVKFDTSGNYIWAKALSGTGFRNDGPYLKDLVLDDAGDLYVTGSGRGETDFDPGPGTAPAGVYALRGFDIIFAKYDSNGNYLWVKNIEGPNHFAHGNAITRNGNNIYITGNFNDRALDFDPGPGVANLGPSAEDDIFLAKYDTSGKYICAQHVGGQDVDYATGVAADSKGNVYATGYYASPVVDFDPGPGVANIERPERPLANPGDAFNSFLLKLSCKDTSLFQSVAVCGEGNSYTLNDSTYTTSGIYTQVLSNASVVCGCDSIIVLDLTIIPLNKPMITVDGFTLGLTTTYTSYQWFRNGILIPGATGSTYEVSENAGYTVAVINDNGCPDTSAIYTVTNVAINELHQLASQISIYPNPATNIVYIQRPASVPLNITVSGVEGNIILNAGNASGISLKELSNGIYFVRVTDKEGNLVKIEKLVKQ